MLHPRPPRSAISPLTTTLALLLSAITLLHSSANAQTDNSPVSTQFTDPTGKACASGTGAIYALTGTLYTCQSGVFATASVASGGLAPFTTDGINVYLTSGNLLVAYTLLGPKTIAAGANQIPAAAAANTNFITVISDAASASDCTAGGGTSKALCISTGSIWTPLGGGGASGTFTARGTYAEGTTYAALDLVQYNGVAYASIQSANTGHTPNTSPTWWATPGAQGPTGATGATGPTGSLATSDTTHSAAVLYSGLTSGGMALAAADVAGTLTTLILPTDSSNATTGKVLTLGDVTTCPTLPTGMPTTCRSASWSTAGGGMVYPGAGIPQSTGSAWGTSIAVGQAATASTIAQRNAAGELIATNTVPTGKTPMAMDTVVAAAQLTAANMPATPLPTPGTSITLAAPRGYAICTGTCTVAVPTPAAGNEFCVRNGMGVSTAITLSALGAGKYYEKTDGSAYGTANGTMTATAAAGNKICIVGLDSAHYLTLSYAGTWTAN